MPYLPVTSEIGSQGDFTKHYFGDAAHYLTGN